MEKRPSPVVVIAAGLSLVVAGTTLYLLTMKRSPASTPGGESTAAGVEASPGSFPAGGPSSAAGVAPAAPGGTRPPGTATNTVGGLGAGVVGASADPTGALAAPPHPPGPARQPLGAIPDDVRTETPAPNPADDERDPAFRRLLNFIPKGGPVEDQLRALWHKHEDGRRALMRGEAPAGYAKDQTRETTAAQIDSDFEASVISLIPPDKRGQFLMEKYKKR